MSKKKCTIKYGEVILFRDSENHFFLKLTDTVNNYKEINLADYVNAERLNEQIDNIEKKYKPNGLCYELTKKLLEKYTFYALVMDKNKSEEKKIRNEIEKKQETEDYSYHITDEIDEQLCINDILYRRSSSRRMLSYFSKLENLGLAAEGVRLVNKAYKCLMDSKDPELIKEAMLVKGIKLFNAFNHLPLAISFSLSDHFSLKRLSAFFLLTTFLLKVKPSETCIVLLYRML